MNLVVFAIICLILGLTNAEVLAQINGKNILINDDSKKDLAERKLLYVVGVYPEWEKQIVKFKKKWGNEGEKYLAQPNVYIHGDIEELKSNHKNSAETPKKPNVIEVPDNKEYNEDSIEKRRTNDPNMIKSELPGTLQPNLTAARRSYFDRRQEEYMQFLKDTENSNAGKNDQTANSKNNDPMKLPSKYLLKGADKLEISDMAEGNDDFSQIKYPYIDQIYQRNWNRRSDNLGKENIKTDGDFRKYRNIDRMYGRILARRFGSGDMIDKSDDSSIVLEKKLKTIDEIAPRNWNVDQENDKLIDDDDTNDSRRYIPGSIMQNLKYIRPEPNTNTRFVRPKFKKNQQAQELRWIKRVLIPRIINDKRYGNSNMGEIKTNPNLGDDGGIQTFKQTYPTLNMLRKNIKNKSNDNTSGTEEIKDRKKINPKLVDSLELIKQEIGNNRLKKEFQKQI